MWTGCRPSHWGHHRDHFHCLCQAGPTSHPPNLSLPAVLPAISHLNVGGRGDALVAGLPGLGTAFYAAGKASQIFVTHSHGARKVLVWIMCVGGAVSCACVAIGQPGYMTVGWCGVSFCMAHSWGATTAIAAIGADRSPLLRKPWYQLIEALPAVTV